MATSFHLAGKKGEREGPFASNCFNGGDTCCHVTYFPRQPNKMSQQFPLIVSLQWARGICNLFRTNLLAFMLKKSIIFSTFLHPEGLNKIKARVEMTIPLLWWSLLWPIHFFYINFQNHFGNKSPEFPESPSSVHFLLLNCLFFWFFQSSSCHLLVM